MKKRAVRRQKGFYRKIIKFSSDEKRLFSV